MILHEVYNLDEMARIGYVNEYELFVRTNDLGKLPHFHIVDRNIQGKQFHCCVRIDCAEYFKHTGKEDTLNSKARKALVTFLKSKGPGRRDDLTNWEWLLTLWNMNNSDIQISYDSPIPDYKNMEDK